MVDERLASIVRNCRNTTAGHCGGCLEPTATGQPGAYVSTVLLSTGSVGLSRAEEPDYALKTLTGPDIPDV